MIEVYQPILGATVFSISWLGRRKSQCRDVV